MKSLTISGFIAMYVDNFQTKTYLLLLDGLGEGILILDYDSSFSSLNSFIYKSTLIDI